MNVAVGALIGAIAGVTLYGLNVASSHQEFNVGQALTVAAIGATSGALISTGVGAVAGVELFAGVGMAASAGGQLVANAITGNDFKTANFLVASAYGFANGALGPIAGTTLVGATALGATTSATSYAVTNVINGDPITVGGVLGSTVAGATGGIIGGQFPSFGNTQFVDNAADYLLQEGAGSFTRGFLGVTLGDTATNIVHPTHKSCIDEGQCY